MLEDGRCSLCEIPEHHSTSAHVAPPVPATPSTTRRHAQHVRHAHQLHSSHTRHSSSPHTRHSSSPEAAPVSEHKRHTFSQFTNMNYTPRHAINEEPIYSSRSRHAVNEEPVYSSRSRQVVNDDPTFIQELSSFMKKSHRGYDGEASRNLNNNDLNYNHNPNAFSDNHLYGYSNEPSYKINNLPRVDSRSRSNSYNNQILNPKGLYGPNSRSNTLPTNMLSLKRGSQVSSMQDVDQDYFLNMQRSHFSIDGMKKRETRKQRITIQSVVLIGCFSLLFVVGIIMFVAVCYQNGWLGLGKETPQVDNLSRIQNDLYPRYDQNGNFPDNVHRQRGTGSDRIQNEYPRIGLSGSGRRRQNPAVYDDRVYQQSTRFARRIGQETGDNQLVNGHLDELPITYQQSPQFERLIDNQAFGNYHEINHINELPNQEILVDSHQIATIPNSFLQDDGHPKENLQSSFRNQELKLYYDQLSLAFTDNKTSEINNIEQSHNTNSHLLQDRVVINVPHHSIELSPHESLEKHAASNVMDDTTNMFGQGRDEETIPSNESNTNLKSHFDIIHENLSTSSNTERSKIVTPQLQENSPTLSSSQVNNTVPLQSLSRLLKAEPSRSRILKVVAGVLISSDAS